MPDSPDRVADAKDRLRLAAALALQAVASLDAAGRRTAARLRPRPLPTQTDVRALRASVSDLTRAVRDLDRA